MSNIKDFDSIDQGSTIFIAFTMRYEGEFPINLTGYDARLQVRRSYGDTTALINATLANGKIVWVNAAQGTLELRLEPSDTSGIRFNNKDDATLDLVYDLELMSPFGKVIKPAKGAITLNREVTR